MYLPNYDTNAGQVTAQPTLHLFPAFRTADSALPPHVREQLVTQSQAVPARVVTK
jgi:hypothetical protein